MPYCCKDNYSVILHAWGLHHALWGRKLFQTKHIKVTSICPCWQWRVLPKVVGSLCRFFPQNKSGVCFEDLRLSIIYTNLWSFWKGVPPGQIFRDFTAYFITWESRLQGVPTTLYTALVKINFDLFGLYSICVCVCKLQQGKKPSKWALTRYMQAWESPPDVLPTDCSKQ